MRAEFDQYDWLGEGDSALWVPLVDVGLRGIEGIDSYNYGSWAGRFGWTKANGEAIRTVDLSTDYNYITGEMSNPGGGFFGGSTYSGNQFLEAFMLDWAARADWTVSADANDPPVVSAADKDITAAAGEVVALNGSAADPDGDRLNVKWWVYEGGSKYSGVANNLRVWDEDKTATKFTVPKDAQPGDYFNLILEVTDDAGQYSSFTRYAQVIVKVPAAPAAAPANPTNDSLTINGAAATPAAYKINDENYFKLRDLAALLSGTGSQFDVDWDGATQSAAITTGQPYERLPSDLQGRPAAGATASLSDDVVYLNGTQAELTIYKVNDNNYIKLRDLGILLDFFVGYENGAIVIDTTRPYSE